ncbi:MAG: hypothetical protein K9G60_01925 [Pseudolabrys sp.]|nr:hypothetical protein [Pseudolabrys sp.]
MTETQVRYAASRKGYRVCKTPSRHWTRAHREPGYMLVDGRNTVVLGPEYGATLAEVAAFVAEME